MELLVIYLPAFLVGVGMIYTGERRGYSLVKFIGMHLTCIACVNILAKIVLTINNFVIALLIVATGILATLVLARVISAIARNR